VALVDSQESGAFEKRLTSTDFAEIGATGLIQYQGEVREEFLRQLQGRSGYATYREMADNNPVIGAILHAVDMLIRTVDWQVEPSDPDEQQSVEIAEFVSSCLTDMSHSWADTLSSILSMLVYGFSYHEIVYKRRNGPEAKDSGNRSRHEDGLIGWRKLPIRDQNTIRQWKFDDEGGIQGAYQEDVLAGRNDVFIPIEKALLFRTTTQRNNPKGRSILRNAFVSWYYQKRIQEIEAIGIERDLAGLPIALVPPHLLSNNATVEEAAALDEIKKIVRNIRRDEQEGVVFPLVYDPETGQQAYKLELMSSGGGRQFDTSQIIARYDQRIAMTVLADFILLGHDQVGTQALSVSKIQLFADSLAAWLQGITGVFNSHAIPRLLQINGISLRNTPQLTFTPPRQVDISVIGDYVGNLVGAGALFPDQGLQEYLRNIAGLPLEESEQV
jgi:hypothetical protein